MLHIILFLGAGVPILRNRREDGPLSRPHCADPEIERGARPRFAQLRWRLRPGAAPHRQECCYGERQPSQPGWHTHSRRLGSHGILLLRLQRKRKPMFSGSRRRPVSPLRRFAWGRGRWFDCRG
jgi:hypothetical protein